jgi:flagellin-like protein
MYNKKAVSAVIGVILMVAITVAIAATVYVYVESLRSHSEEEIVFTVEGWVIDAFDTKKDILIDGETYDIWKLTLGQEYDTEMQNTTSFYCVFTHGNAPPPETVHLRLFYTTINDEEFGTVFDIYKVKSL